MNIETHLPAPWKDVSSFSQGEKDRTPKTWQIHIGRFRISLFRPRGAFTDVWVANGNGVLGDRVMDSPNLSEAAEQAKQLLRATLEESLAELSRTEHEAPTSSLQDTLTWVVNDMGELGVEINGQVLFCYKGESLSYANCPFYEDGSPILYRKVGKREFGETVWPLAWHIADRSQERYTVETVYTPGLSFGAPDNPDYKWKPLPSAQHPPTTE